MSTRQQKRAELRRRMKETNFRLAFDHAGAVCPGCGYVFSNGFSPITDGEAEERVTVCSRCRRILILVMASGHLRFATEEETAKINADASPDLALLRDVLTWNRQQFD